jgi:hypothetical protein
MKALENKIRAAIIGPSEGGKTELAISFSLWLWKHYGIRTLAFDPWLREKPKRWGAHSWVTDEMPKFEHVVFKTHGCAVFWDEATTNGGRDRDKVRFFTEVRHNHQALFALGHCYSAFLPVMRVCLTDLYLALDDVKDAEEWAAQMKDAQVMEATTLGQYQFLHKRAFRPVAIRKHSLSELQAGVSP